MHADDTDDIKTTLRTAMQEALPFLSGCYEKALPKLARPKLTISTHMTLTGDPDVGTLIDVEQLFDDNGTALPAALDACLRDALQSLELPPLAEGDKVSVTYPFMFDQN